jgi:hypothetical protein
MLLIEKALSATRETKQIEFKQSFDPNSTPDWCEIIKDIVAMANSGGGVILFGVDNKGLPTGGDVQTVLALDPATLDDKLHSYTEVHFADFEILTLAKDGVAIAALKIGSSEIPLIFVKPGTYAISPTKQTTAFGRGTIYFRHGAKSESGVSDDLRQVLARRLNEVRRQWLTGVTKVVRAPEGSTITVVQSDIIPATAAATAIRVVDDPSAPEMTLADPNSFYPYRQIDVVEQLHKRIASLQELKSYDILVVRRVFEIDKKKEFVYKPKFASPQYSERFLDWLIQHHSEDHDFFPKARTQFQSQVQRTNVHVQA